MAEGIIKIADVELDTPIGYTHDPIKLETGEYSIGGILIINRTVTPEDQSKSRYTFVITDIVNSKMLDLKAEVAHISNLDYIDYLQIVEVLSGDGSTKIFYTQRRMSGDTPVPVITLDDDPKTVTVTELTNPDPDNIYAKADVNGRARFIFGDTPLSKDDNIIIQYEPKYLVHIPSNGFRYTGRIKNIAHFSLTCREAK
jgi:hypothetical protein